MDSSRGDEAPKSDGSVTSRDDGDAGHAVSQRSSGRRGDEAKPDANESHAAARTLVLKGHSQIVTCLAVLDGERFASGSSDRSIIISNLADGTQLANR